MRRMDYNLVDVCKLRDGEEGYVLAERYNSKYKTQWRKEEIKQGILSGKIAVYGFKISTSGSLLLDKDYHKYAEIKRKMGKKGSKQDNENGKLSNLSNLLTKRIEECYETENTQDCLDERDRLVLSTRVSVYSEILSYVETLKGIK